MKGVLRRVWLGLVLALAGTVGSAIYSLFGPLPAGFNWAALAVVVLVIPMVVLALVAEYGRKPNPFLRTYPHDPGDLPVAYDLRYLPPDPPVLDSRAADVLWNLPPLALVAFVLAKFVAKF